MQLANAKYCEGRQWHAPGHPKLLVDRFDTADCVVGGEVDFAMADPPTNPVMAAATSLNIANGQPSMEAVTKIESKPV